MRSLSISLLGPVQVRLDDILLTHFRSSRTKALLIYLVENRSIAHQRESLMAFFWADMLPRSAQTNLRQTLYQLNKLLPKVASKRSEGEVPLLLADRKTIRVNPDAAINCTESELAGQIWV